jgi:hypothetical protein
MTDSIESSDIRRADQSVDPTALGSEQVAEALPDDEFTEEAKQEFANKVADRRSSVSQEASREVLDSVGEPGANNTRMVYGSRVEDGQTVAVGGAQNLTQEVQADGTVIAENTDTGTRAEVGSIDLSKGAEGRSDEW